MKSNHTPEAIIAEIDRVLLEEEAKLAELKKWSQDNTTFEVEARNAHLDTINQIGEIVVQSELL